MTRRALIAACALALVVAAGPADARTGDVTGHRQSRAATAGPIPGAVRSVSAGHGHSCALLRDGAVKCWGHNDYGQLGLGDDENRGDQPGEMGADLPTVELGTGRTATAVSAGADHTCALLDDGTVRCWGRGERLGLGLGHTQDRGDDPGEMGDALAPVDLGTGRTATRISAGVNHTCALLDDATVKCWGDNGHGRLGLGDTATRGDQPGEMGDALPAVDLGTGRTATAVFAGGAHSCARLDDGSVKCWGSGEFGMLGLGDVGNRGDSPGEMGDQIPALDLGTGRTVTAIGHACALLDDATVKCWGDNSAGQLGQGDEVRRGDDPGEMGDHLPTVDLGTGRTVTAISDDGYGHPCALLDDGTLRCWGPNWRGRLGLGDTDDRGDEPGEMGDQLAPVDLGDGLRAVEVDSGTEHECARLDDATVKCWGGNQYGQLGLGDTEDRGDAPGEMGAALAPVDLADPAVPELTLTLAPDRPLAFTGETVDYALSVRNTGNVHLTATDVSVPGTTGCDQGLGTFRVGDRHDAACRRAVTVTDVGPSSVTALARSNETGPVESAPATVEVAFDRQPDLVVKKAGRPPRVGGDRYGTDPTDPDQRLTAGRRRGGRVVFVAIVENDGDAPARFRVHRLGSDAGLVVRYRVGPADVTRAVVGGTYRTARVEPGGSARLRVEVTVTSTALRRVDHDVTLRARSMARHRQVDTVMATVVVN